MLLERLLDNLAVHVEPFARCDVASGCCLHLRDLGWVTLHYVLQGEGELRTADGTVHALCPGTLAVIPADMTHTIRYGTGDQVIHIDHTEPRDAAGLLRYVAAPHDAPIADGLVIACGELQALYAEGLGLFDLLREPVVVDLSDTPAMLATFERMLEESERPGPGSRVMLASLMNAAMVQLFRRLCEGPDCGLPWLQALDDPRLARVLEHLLERPGDDHSVESLAAQAAMSRSVFAETFHTQFGRPPMDYLRELRLRRGAELLRSTELTVERVAHRVGFASRSHFSRAFHHHFGRSPAAFRTEPSPPPAHMATSLPRPPVGRPQPSVSARKNRSDGSSSG
jgi:AraC-like DNA-binding protein